MLAVQGYYDGTTIRPLEEFTARPDQRAIITVLDDFVDLEERTARVRRLRGILSEFAGPALTEKEKGAWERAAAEKHGTA